MGGKGEGEIRASGLYNWKKSYILLPMKQHSFSIVIEHDKHGYFASCPELQGCYSQGATYEEVMANIKDAIMLHVEDRRANNEEISIVDSVSISTVAVAI